MTTPQISLTSGRSWGRAPASPQSPVNEPASSAISKHSESEKHFWKLFEYAWWEKFQHEYVLLEIINVEE